MGVVFDPILGRARTGESVSLTPAQQAAVDSGITATKVSKYDGENLITTIPADAASPIALTDATAAANDHCYSYYHTPDSAPTYQLPAVTDTTVVRYIVLTVKFDATTSIAFRDSAGNPLVMDKEITISSGDVFTFLCEYNALLAKWCIYPGKDGVSA